ncbi:hypothetical protein Tco_0294023 [Tanacetum coccineum]
MLSAAKIPLFFWAEASATTCFTENRSLVIPRHEKTPYHIINERNLQLNSFTSLAPCATLTEMFSPMFDEYFNGATSVVSKSFAVPTNDTSDKRQQQNTTSSTSTTVAAYTTLLNIQTTSEPTTQAPSVTATENSNINQADIQAKNIMVDEDEFINIFSTPIQEVRESSSRHVDPLNMHTFYQQHPSEYH